MFQHQFGVLILQRGNAYEEDRRTFELEAGTTYCMYFLEEQIGEGIGVYEKDVTDNADTTKTRIWLLLL